MRVEFDEVSIQKMKQCLSILKRKTLVSMFLSSVLVISVLALLSLVVTTIIKLRASGVNVLPVCVYWVSAGIVLISIVADFMISETLSCAKAYLRDPITNRFALLIEYAQGFDVIREGGGLFVKDCLGLVSLNDLIREGCGIELELPEKFELIRLGFDFDTGGFFCEVS